MRDFKTLVVWQKAHKFVVNLYQTTKDFPREELYGLTDQFRRAAVSIPANIAEGFGKQGDKERARYISIALGSAAETEYYLILARDLGYLSPTKADELHHLFEDIQPMLRALYTRMISNSK
jgi:four helix bundle protein